MFQKFGLAWLFLVACPNFSLAADFLPDARVFMNELITATGEKGDTQALHQVSSHVDFEELAQSSLGKRWKKYSAPQRKEFLDTLQSLLELVAYPKAKKMSVKPEDISYAPVDSKPTQVRASGQIKREEKGEVVSQKADIIFVFNPTTRKIVDAVIDDELLSGNLKRQFDAALKKESFQSIIDRMKKRRDEAKNPKA